MSPIIIPAPLMGDIGEPLKHTEMEPVEEPIPATVPEEVPSR